MYLLAKAYQTAHGVFKKNLKSFGLTPLQNLILEVLWKKDAITIGEISKKVSVDYATLSSLLDRMVSTGWIKKNKNPQDRRSFLIELTPKARSRKKELLACQEFTNQYMTQKLSEPEKLLLFRILKDLRDVVPIEIDT